MVNWSYKNPDKDGAKEKTHWLTYQANITRHGRRFTRKGKDRCEFCWLEDVYVTISNLIGNIGADVQYLAVVCSYKQL